MGIIDSLAMGSVVMDAGIYIGSAAMLWGALVAMTCALTVVFLSRELDAPQSA